MSGFLKTKAALGIWAVLIVLVCARCYLRPGKGSVVPVFTEAAQNWRMQSNLYLPIGSPFRYSPVVALGFVPLSFLAAEYQEVVWRLLNAFVYLFALRYWFRTRLQSCDTQQWNLFLLLVLPLSVGSLNNGQSNGIVLGMLLLADAATAHKRWNFVGISLVIAILYKIYPISFALLLVLIHPSKLAWRLCLGIALGLLLPFVFAPNDYVLRQYQLWIGDLMLDDRQPFAREYWYRDIRLLLANFGLIITPLSYLGMELVIAAMMALWTMRKGRDNPEVILTLACIWMTAFGPATESCSYIYLAPVIARALLLRRQTGATALGNGLLYASFTLFCMTAMSVWFPGARHYWHAWGPHALAAIVFAAACMASRIGLPGPSDGEIDRTCLEYRGLDIIPGDPSCDGFRA